jgi:hypothetical protein
MSAEGFEGDEARRAETEIWGLSGWFLNELLRGALLQI